MVNFSTWIGINEEQQNALEDFNILGITQIASWGSMFYAFSLLAPEIQRGLGWRSEVVFGAFSWSILVSSS